mgnify:CR=1 FL=1
MSNTLDGTNILTKYSVRMDGSEFSFDVTGFESLSVVKLFIDGVLYYKCNVNFTSDSPQAINETYYSVEEETTTGSCEIPSDLVGLSVNFAEQKLKLLGFTNITKRPDFSQEYEANDVFKITPEAGTEVSYDSPIVLYYVRAN